MANPSSSRHDIDDRERERERRHRSDRERRSSSSSHHHHRTISSTTLLLVLSLILAVLAVMLSLPNGTSSSAAVIAGKEKEDAAAKAQEAHWGILTPKRSQALVARESAVAAREAEVARREAEVLVGAPGGVIPTQTAAACPVCVPEPAQTVIKEVVPESALAPPSWFKEAGTRAEEILDRELKIAEREREISKREESVNRREHDASRRESWIMEQLISLGNEHPPQSVHETIEDEYVQYEPQVPKRKVKQPYHPQQFPPIYDEAPYEIEIMTVTETLPPSTVTLPPPANTRLAAYPKPEGQAASPTTYSPRTTAINIEIDEPTPTVAYGERRPPPAKWFGGW
ncbi:hypothetical protein HWV62_5838 [Athelia sp. TMB]|nr:hypothetical protein HWV62_7019 [Athelia sp. TMB]KAF7976691.1 hypothetical protein HWV62_5838 [Athelia sp. TMB]